MRKILLLLITLIVGLAGQTAMATTKTYIFSGQQTDQTQFTGYFYNEASPSTHYNCTPSPWTYGTTGSISFTLADGITLTLSSSTNKIQYLADNGLFAKGEATLTVSGGSTYYIYRIRLLDGNGNVIQLDGRFDDRFRLGNDDGSRFRLRDDDRLGGRCNRSCGSDRRLRLSDGLGFVRFVKLHETLQLGELQLHFRNLPVDDAQGLPDLRQNLPPCLFHKAKLS